jgi:DNA-binding XRE family transcriptional regulator
MTTAKDSEAFRNRRPRKRIRKGRRPINAMRYREHLAALGLTQQEAAAFLDVDERTSRRWANGEGGVPLMTAYVLAVMVKHKLTVADMQALVEESWRV